MSTEYPKVKVIKYQSAEECIEKFPLNFYGFDYPPEEPIQEDSEMPLSNMIPFLKLLSTMGVWIESMTIVEHEVEEDSYYYQTRVIEFNDRWSIKGASKELRQAHEWLIEQFEKDLSCSEVQMFVQAITSPQFSTEWVYFGDCSAYSELIVRSSYN
jgi:hypothetical protein